MIRRWLRNWLGIQALDDQLGPRPTFVSREGKRIEPPSVVSTVTIGRPDPLPLAEPAVKKGYDAPV